MDHSATETIKVSESQADFARRLGVSRQRVNAMLRDGMPIMANGRLDVEACLRWVRANVEPRRGGVNPPPSDEDADDDGIDLTEARRLKILVDTEFTKVLLAKERGDLVNRAGVRRALAEFVRQQRTVIDNFANRYAAQMAAELGYEDTRRLTITLELWLRKLNEAFHQQKMPPVVEQKEG